MPVRRARFWFNGCPLFLYTEHKVRALLKEVGSGALQLDRTGSRFSRGYAFEMNKMNPVPSHSAKEREAARSHAEPLRVLHIITRLIVGGAPENTLLTVEGLNRIDGYEVTLLTGVDYGPEGDLLDRARKTTRLVVLPELARKINPLEDIMALVELYRLIRKGRYHIVHTHSSKAGVLGGSRLMAGTPIIVHTLHSLVFHEYQPWVVNKLWRSNKEILRPDDGSFYKRIEHHQRESR